MASEFVVADRFAAALSHRTRAIDGGERCHLFLLLAGDATLAGLPQPEIEMVAPTMLWLPHSARGTCRSWPAARVSVP